MIRAAWQVLREAIGDVPAVKYALGVAGVAAAFSLARQFFDSPREAVVAVLFMLALMVMLLVFAIATSRQRALVGAGSVLVWGVLILFTSSAVLIVSSVFFDWPKSFPDLAGQLLPGSEPHIEPDVRYGSDFSLQQLSPPMRTPLPADTPPSRISAELARRGSLTIDGVALVVGAPGENGSASLTVHTLTLLNGAIIVTNGNTLDLRVAKLIVGRGEIASFKPQDSTANDGANGLAGGTVVLESSREIDGTLSVRLPGQAGGRGVAGAAGAPGPAGGRGADAADIGFPPSCGHGGGDGAPGGQGAPGLPGGKGGKGGDGGRLVLRGSPATFRGHILFEPARDAPGGLGGEGGAGGAGGPGGPGGQGGSGSAFCGGGHVGPQGPQGPPGPAGPRGDDGRPGTLTAP